MFHEGERHLVLLDTETREKLLDRGLGLESGYCAAFSPDGKRVVLGKAEWREKMTARPKAPFQLLLRRMIS